MNKIRGCCGSGWGWLASRPCCTIAAHCGMDRKTVAALRGGLPRRHLVCPATTMSQRLPMTGLIRRSPTRCVRPGLDGHGAAW